MADTADLATLQAALRDALARAEGAERDLATLRADLSAMSAADLVLAKDQERQRARYLRVRNGARKACRKLWRERQANYEAMRDELSRALDADYNLAVLREQLRWRDAATEPPKANALYLVTGPDVGVVADWISCGWYWESRIRHPTHWLPLPEPPEAPRG